MAESCPIRITGINTHDVVNSQVALSQAWASQAFDMASDLVSQLEAFTVKPVDTELDFEVNLTYRPFQKPTSPTLPPIDFSFTDAPPSEPALRTPELRVDDPPATTLTAPLVNFPAAPVRQAGDPPGDPPTLTDYTFPDAPSEDDLQISDPPVIEDVVLPPVPVVNIDPLLEKFNELLDNAPIIPPDLLDGFDFNAAAEVDAEYNRGLGRADTFMGRNTLEADVLHRVTTMLGGGTGLPAPIEQALFDRAIEREDGQALAARQEVMDDWCARGFTLPAGVAQRRLDTVSQGNQSAKRQLIRDIYIQAATFEIENLRFAVGQGISLEGQYRGFFLDLQRHATNVAQLTLAAATAVFNARIEVFRAEITLYTTQIQSFNQAIQLELAKLELYRSELEGIKIATEIDQLRVEVYKAELEAVETRVNVFNTQVAAVSAQIDAEAKKIDAFRSQVEAYRAEVEADKANFEAYGEQVRAEAAKIDAFEAEVRAFAERIRAYEIGVNAAVSKEEFLLRENEQRINIFRAQVENYRTKLLAEQTRIQSLATAYNAEANLYTAEIGVEQARVGASSQQLELELQRLTSTADLRMKEADLNINQLIRSAQLGLQSLEAAARTSAQLAASSMSAVNVGASIGDRTSKSDNTSCSTQFIINE